jgi:hypothetical protein
VRLSMIGRGWLAGLLLLGCSPESNDDPDLGRDLGRRLDAATSADWGASTSDAAAPPDGGCTGTSCGELPIHEWVAVLDGGVDFDQGRAIAVDPTGHVVISGPFNGTLTHGAISYVSRGDRDVFVARFDPAGSLLWVRTFGSTLADTCRGVGTDAEGNIYLTGQYEGGGVTLGGPVLPHEAGDGKNIFVASFDMNGIHRWSRGYAGPGTDTGNAIAVQGERVYVVGKIAASTELPGGEVSTVEDTDDAFLLVFDRSGALMWQRVYGGPGNDSAQAVAVTDNDKPHVAGAFQSAVTFGVAGERSAEGATDMFVLKLTAAGEERHLTTFGGTDATASARSIAITEGRGVVVAGRYQGTIAFEGASSSSTGGDGVIIRMDNTLVPQWHQTLGGPGSDRVLGVTFGAGGQVFVTGQFAETASVAGESLTSEGAIDVFVAAYDDALGGAARWGLGLGSTAGDWGWGVATHGDRLFVTGAVRGPADFGSGSVSAATDGDAFLAAYRIR